MGRSALSVEYEKIHLIRWDISKTINPGNLIALTKAEAAKHIAKSRELAAASPAEGDGGQKSLLMLSSEGGAGFYTDEQLQYIYRRFEMERLWKKYR